MMELTEFVRRPFTVQAVEITAENIEEMAERIGTVREKGNGTKYIEVDRTKIPTLDRVYIGFWFTLVGNNARCYSRKVFMSQFLKVTAARGEALEALMAEPRPDANQLKIVDF